MAHHRLLFIYSDYYKFILDTLRPSDWYGVLAHYSPSRSILFIHICFRSNLLNYVHLIYSIYVHLQVAAVATLHFLGFYIFRSANSQKDSFRRDPNSAEVWLRRARKSSEIEHWSTDVTCPICPAFSAACNPTCTVCCYHIGPSFITPPSLPFYFSFLLPKPFFYPSSFSSFFLSLQSSSLSFSLIPTLLSSYISAHPLFLLLPCLPICLFCRCRKWLSYRPREARNFWLVVGGV